MENEQKIIKEKIVKNKPNKSFIFKKILAWSSVVLIILFTIFMMIVGGFISLYELTDESGIIGVPLAMPIAVFIGTIISLGAVLSMTWYFFWDPVNEKLEERKKKIEKNINDANLKNEEADINNKASSEELNKSKQVALEIISNSKKEGNDLKKEIVNSGKNQNEFIMKKSREQISIEKKQMYEDIKQEIISTSILAAEKIIERELDDSSNKKLVEELIEKLKE